jgi:predicted O-methyltransferase YrrM
MRKVQAKSYNYIENLSESESAQKLLAREKSVQLGLEAISLSKTEARIFQFYLADLQPRKIVEIGTLTGLSALYMLESLQEGGKLWTLEKSPAHAQMASEVLASYIANKSCQLLVGDAREKLNEIVTEGPFDAVFIDGNKAAYLDYFNWAVANARIGGLIVADNVFLAGAVWGDQTQQKFNDKQIGAVNEMNRLAHNSANLRSVILPTEEGLLICKKLS